jgi:hypothetical protein
MKGFYPHLNVPDWLDSPVPVFRARTRIFKHFMNCAVLLTHTILSLSWPKGNCPTASLDHFPWLAVSLLFAALLLVVEDPIFRNYRSVIVGHYINILSCFRLVFLCFSLQTIEGMKHFLELETFVLDVSNWMVNKRWSVSE